jgi:hypothetical protein
VLDSLAAKCKQNNRQPSLRELVAAFYDTVKLFKQVYVVLDALDESNVIRRLMDVVKGIIDLECSGLHVSVTSRQEPDIVESLKSTSWFKPENNSVCLETNIVNQDIKAYVVHELDNNEALRKWATFPKLRTDIETTLSQKANGM